MPVANGQGRRNGQHPAPAAAPYVPPQSIEAEQSTLGAMLIEPAAIDKAASLLGPADFYREEHKAVFAATLALHKQGRPVDLITLPEELKARGQFEQVGGIAFLTALFDTVPTAANVEEYAGIVAGKASLRALLTAADAASAAARVEGADPADVARRMEEAARRASQGTAKTPEARRKPLAERIVDMADVGPPLEVLPLWWVLMPGMIHWVSAPPGLGKSTIAYNIVTAIAEGQPLWGWPPGKPCKTLYVDLESGDNVLAVKLERLYQGTPRVRGGVLFLGDIRLPEEIHDLIRLCQTQSIDLVVFDTAARTFRLKDENDNSEVGRTVTPMLDAIKEAGIASLVIGHTSKGGTGARGASAIEGNADVTLSVELHRGKIGDKDALVSLSVRKHKLLGFPPPLILERVGEDQFRAVDAATIPQEEAPPTASIRCASDLLAYVEAQDGPARYGEIVAAMKKKGHAEATAKRVIAELQTQEDLLKTEGGYTLPDPFAD